VRKFPFRVCGRTYVKAAVRVCIQRDGKTQIALRFNEAYSSGYYRGDRIIVSSPRGGSHLIIIPHIPKPAVMTSQYASSRSSRRRVSCFPRSISWRFLKTILRITVAISRKVIVAVCDFSKGFVRINAQIEFI